MKYIDLHIHSNASDGTFTPTQIVSLAAEKELSAIALTDHDTVDGVEEALLAALAIKNKGVDIRVISGIEISAAYKKTDIHIVGLFVDPTNQNLLHNLNEARMERNQRNEKMLQNLRSIDLAITMEELKEEDANAVLTRAHFAKLLYKKGYVKSIQDAFKKYLGDDTPYYVSREYTSPESAISLIKEAGGIPILAHPFLYKMKEHELKNLIINLKSVGLAGLEAIYSNNINNEEAYARFLAKKYDLLISGGSDFHGSVKPSISIGIGKGNLKVPQELLTKMEHYLLDK